MIEERLALVSRKCRTAAHIPGPGLTVQKSYVHWRSVSKGEKTVKVQLHK